MNGVAGGIALQDNEHSAWLLYMCTIIRVHNMGWHQKGKFFQVEFVHCLMVN